MDEALRGAKEAENPTPNNMGKSTATNPAAARLSSSQASGAIKHREPWKVILFSIITLGIYGIYWHVSTSKELRKNTPSGPNPRLLLLFLIPFVNIFFIFFYFWKYSCAIHELTGYDIWTLFLLWIFVSPAAIWIAQQELNKKADN